MKIWERWKLWADAMADPERPPPTPETPEDREFRLWAEPTTAAERKAVLLIDDPQDRIDLLSELRLAVRGTLHPFDPHKRFWEKRRESLETREMCIGFKVRTSDRFGRQGR